MYERARWNLMQVSKYVTIEFVMEAARAGEMERNI